MSADTRTPVERARDILAACLAEEFGDGITVTHDDSGWQARRNGVVFCRSQTGPGLRALVPYMGTGPDTGDAA
jgi:hypothetical protein